MGRLLGPTRDDVDLPERHLAELFPDTLWNEPDQPHGYAGMPA
ncbi:hypothetical protein [Phytohabitans aurantiacus]|uniref:Uncharacterized protein n=1 Tax=Phytohabitans aurantiacus TaxID=3016789 RepID=A0ABQ5R031_9ACTN|nr:hypothetical protein [Phytohabitans aurantiacus]GLH99902.1 hypothetical protein Pa4123_51780 [Phytohabitans aurantiacus]